MTGVRERLVARGQHEDVGGAIPGGHVADRRHQVDAAPEPCLRRQGPEALEISGGPRAHEREMRAFAQHGVQAGQRRAQGCIRAVLGYL